MDGRDVAALEFGQAELDIRKTPCGLLADPALLEGKLLDLAGQLAKFGLKPVEPDHETAPGSAARCASAAVGRAEARTDIGQFRVDDAEPVFQIFGRARPCPGLRLGQLDARNGTDGDNGAQNPGPSL